MKLEEWSRSRYWLFWFLQSRHLRARIKWCKAEAPKPDSASPDFADHQLTPLFDGLPGWDHAERVWLAKAVSDHARIDPALVQAIRLMLREADHHEQQLARWRLLGCPDSPVRPSGWVRKITQRFARFLGPRFELSGMLLTGILRHSTARCIAARAKSPITEALMSDMTRELDGRNRFLAEWLTAEFADFNFIRRNLRRWRLRLLFASILVFTVLRSRRARSEAGISLWEFVANPVARFRQTLEQMVPYQREQLLSALTEQRDNPWPDQSAETH